jgi:hypothetical protein
LATFTPAVRHTVRRAATLSPLRAVLQLARPPPAHEFLYPAETPNPLRPAIPSRHPPPLMPQHSASARWTQHTRRWQCESRSDVGSACLVKVVNSAWAGDVRWVCSRRGWTGTNPHPSTARFAGCLRVVPHLQTLMVGSNTRHFTPLHGVHSTTDGHLGVY